MLQSFIRTLHTEQKGDLKKKKSVPTIYKHYLLTFMYFVWGERGWVGVGGWKIRH